MYLMLVLVYAMKTFWTANPIYLKTFQTKSKWELNMRNLSFPSKHIYFRLNEFQAGFPEKVRKAMPDIYY